MALYLLIIAFANISVALLNIFLGSSPAWFVILACITTTIFEFAIDGLFALIINKLPNKWFGMNNKFYKVSKSQQKFYEKLGIRKWKDKVWELGGLGGFRKNKINEPDNPNYIEQFIIESHKGILTHIVGMFVGFLGLLLFPKHWLVIGLPIAIVNVFLNTLSTMVLQYNLPKLHIVHKRLTRKNNLEN